MIAAQGTCFGRGGGGGVGGGLGAAGFARTNNDLGALCPELTTLAVPPPPPPITLPFRFMVLTNRSCTYICTYHHIGALKGLISGCYIIG